MDRDFVKEFENLVQKFGEMDAEMREEHVYLTLSCRKACELGCDECEEKEPVINTKCKLKTDMSMAGHYLIRALYKMKKLLTEGE